MGFIKNYINRVLLPALQFWLLPRDSNTSHLNFCSCYHNYFYLFSLYIYIEYSQKVILLWYLVLQLTCKICKYSPIFQCKHSRIVNHCALHKGYWNCDRFIVIFIPETKIKINSFKECLCYKCFFFWYIYI